MRILTRVCVLASVSACTLVALNGCSRPISIKRATIYTPLGPIILEGIELGPAGNPPPGLVHDCTGKDEDGNSWSVYTDPSTGEKWVKDKDGDYHPVEDGEIDCGDLSKNVTPIGGPGGIARGANPYIDSTDFSYEVDFSFAFDQAADTAQVGFLLPIEVADHYSSSLSSPFVVQESTTQLFDGSFAITYTGTVSDVLGAVWWLGIRDVEFEDDIAGSVWLNFSSISNSVTIYTDSGNETIVMPFTNPNYVPAN